MYITLLILFAAMMHRTEPDRRLVVEQEQKPSGGVSCRDSYSHVKLARNGNAESHWRVIQGLVASQNIESFGRSKNWGKGVVPPEVTP